MRWLPWRRRPPVPPPSAEDVFVTEEMLRRAAADVFDVRERHLAGDVITLRGSLRTDPGRAAETLVARFRPFGFTPCLRADGGDIVLHALPLVEGGVRSRIGLNLVLFALTVASTVLTGACGGVCLYFPWDVLLLLSEPWRLLAGVPFAVTLLAILGTHEFGHYFAARRHGAAVSLPYFIPAPPPLVFGTLGAVIRMKSQGRDRNALFDIAVAGPLAGLVVAIPAVLLGLEWSRVAPVPTDDGPLVMFGDSLLMRLAVFAKFGRIPEGMDVFIHPVALAGWVGLLVTALNLFPVGQLDGGRISYALFGPRHRRIGAATIAATIALGLLSGSPNWFVWAGVVMLLVGLGHHPPLDDVTPLTRGRYAVGIACLVLLVLLIPPVPIAVQ